MAELQEEKARWCYEQNNKWVDYDAETTKQLEDNLTKGLAHKKKLLIKLKLKYGPRFGTDENKEKYVVHIQVDGSSNPPVIYRMLQLYEKNRYEMVNVTRFPSMETDNTPDQIKEIMDYQCKFKWFWKSEQDEEDEEDEEDDEWRQYDAISSKQIELTLNKKKKFVILNKSNYFKCAKYKNIYRVEFNHHSIPSEATQIEYTGLKTKEKTKVKYEEIDEGQNTDEMNKKMSQVDEVMAMMMLTKHYMRPLSMKYWTQKRVILNDELQCRICIGEFEEENFLEYWISRKLRNKHKEEKEVISAKQIAIQLCRCKGEHFFHCECIAEWFLRKKKCPLCQCKYGITIGNQPKGTMQVIIDKDRDVAGFEHKGRGCIDIIHKFPAGIQGPYHQNPGERYYGDSRYIYLPNTPQGREILELIKIGWKRKVLYSVGQSVTRRTNNSVIWNGVHFKTSRHGGIENWGWPDKTYFKRVKEEFKDKGITVEDIPKRQTNKKQ